MNKGIAFLLAMAVNSFCGMGLNLGAGINLGGTNSKDDNFYKYETHSGFTLQFSNSYYFGNAFSLSLGAGFEEGGEYAKAKTIANRDAEFNVLYFRFPINAKYLFKKNSLGLELIAGGNVSKIISGQLGPTASFNESEFGIEGGAAFHWFYSNNRSLYISPMYYNGLKNVIANSTDTKMRNIRIQFGISGTTF